MDYEYIRQGVVNIFMANGPLKGKRFVKVTEFKTKKDWAGFIKRIADQEYPKAKKITLVRDNFKTHAASTFYETFEPKEAKKDCGTDLNSSIPLNMEAGSTWLRSNYMY